MDELARQMASLHIKENVSSLSEEQKQVLESLNDLHRDHLKVEAEYRLEWNQLKLKYFDKLRPMYNKRAELVSAKAEGEASLNGGTSIPYFWLSAMRNNSTLLNTIEPHDEPVLAYLTDITSDWIDPEEQLSFKFTLHFSPNPFFENSSLTKTFEVEADVETGEHILARTLGTSINWFADKDVTKKLVKRKQRNRATNETRIVVKTVPRDSFFLMLSDRVIPQGNALAKMKPEDVAELEAVLELEYEVGCALRDKIIPHAVGWYLGNEHDEDNFGSELSEDDLAGLRADGDDSEEGDSDEDESEDEE